MEYKFLPKMLKNVPQSGLSKLGAYLLRRDLELVCVCSLPNDLSHQSTDITSPNKIPNKIGTLQYLEFYGCLGDLYTLAHCKFLQLWNSYQ